MLRNAPPPYPCFVKQKRSGRSEQICLDLRLKMLYNQAMSLRKIFITACLFLLFCQGAAMPVYAESDWKATASVAFETGTYGSGSRVDTMYLPLTLKRYYDAADVSVSVPFIRQTSNNDVITTGGMVYKKHGAGATAQNSRSGIGDAVVKGSYYLLIQEPFDFFLIGKIKIPTADKDKGLGTGEFDATVGFESDKKITDDWTAFFDLNYTFVGSPSGSDLNNVVFFDIGLSRKINSLSTGSVFFEQSTPLASGGGDVRDILLNVDYKITNTAKLFAGFSVGLTESSQDYGISGGASINF